MSSACLGHIRSRNRSHRCRSIVADDVRSEGVAKKSKVASFEAVCRALGLERIDIRQSVTRMEGAKVDIGRNGIKDVKWIKLVAMELRRFAKRSGLPEHIEHGHIE